MVVAALLAIGLVPAWPDDTSIVSGDRIAQRGRSQSTSIAWCRNS
jgi:hypothetical protein